MAAWVVVLGWHIGDVDPPLAGLLAMLEDALTEWKVESFSLRLGIEDLDVIRVVERC